MNYKCRSCGSKLQQYIHCDGHSNRKLWTCIAVECCCGIHSVDYSYNFIEFDEGKNITDWGLKFSIGEDKYYIRASKTGRTISGKKTELLDDKNPNVLMQALLGIEEFISFPKTHASARLLLNRLLKLVIMK